MRVSVGFLVGIVLLGGIDACSVRTDEFPAHRNRTLACQHDDLQCFVGTALHVWSRRTISRAIQDRVYRGEASFEYTVWIQIINGIVRAKSIPSTPISKYSNTSQKWLYTLIRERERAVVELASMAAAHAPLPDLEFGFSATVQA